LSIGKEMGNNNSVSENETHSDRVSDRVQRYLNSHRRARDFQGRPFNRQNETYFDGEVYENFGNSQTWAYWTDARDARTFRSGNETRCDGEVGGKLDNSPGCAPVTVGIDLGTTYFGWAYKFRNEKEIIFSKREPTCLLLNPDNTFSALGKKAMDTFYKLNATDQEKYTFFSQFKMRLYDTKKLSRDTELKDENGKTLKAMEIFITTFAQIKDQILQKLNQARAGEITINDVLWMITIPAIWTDEARQFMSEAARKAGLTRTRLVLEPEAAALYVIGKTLEFDRKSGTTARFQVGKKYIVADLGGGTVDMCAHEILEGDHLRELYRATGDYAGGTTVTNKILDFFQKFLGTFGKIKKLNPFSYFTFLKSVEKNKCSFTPSTQDLQIHLHPEQVSISEQHAGKPLEKAIAESEFSNTVSYKKEQQCVKIDKSVVEKFFDKSVNTIINSLNEILEKCRADNITTLLLVGGYSESEYVRNKIEKRFRSMKVISVEDGRYAVVKGAVLMGEKPRDIIERRARFTYGFSFSPDFIEGKHPEKFKFYWEGEALCRGVFCKLIEAGQILHYNQQFSEDAHAQRRLQEHKHRPITTSLWRSPLPDPTYCHDEADQCERVATITAQAPPEGWPDVVNCIDTLIVGETELTVKTLYKETGQELETTIDFL